MKAGFLVNDKSDVTGLLRAEHEKITVELNLAVTQPGEIAGIVRRLAQVCLPHFALEEEIMFPIFARLPAAAVRDDSLSAVGDLPAQVALFRRERGQLHSHHESVSACVKELLAAAYKEGNREVTELAHLLINHERIESDLELAAHELGMLPRNQDEDVRRATPGGVGREAERRTALRSEGKM